MSAAWAQLLLGAALAAEPVPPAVQRALGRAAPAGAEVRVAEYRARPAPDCRVDGAEVGALQRSGPVLVRLHGRTAGGRGCDGWAMARVTVIATVAVAARAIRAGEPLEGSFRLEPRELRGATGPAPEIRPGAIAARAIAAGQAIDETAIAAAGTRRPGDPITVVVSAGPLLVERPGRLLPCARGRGCALLPGGARVEGVLEGDRLRVEVP